MLEKFLLEEYFVMKYNSATVSNGNVTMSDVFRRGSEQ
jgi:hypothetical protein